MVDHRRTHSRRAYHLPGWFFWLTAVACMAALAAVVWTLSHGAKSDDVRAEPTQTASPSVWVSPTARPSPNAAKTTAQPTPEPPKLQVLVLNASGIRGLAADVAETARDAGWAVADVGNWRYGAGHSAVFYPAGAEDTARDLAKDIDIASVEPAKAGMATDQLTVLLAGRP